MLQLQGVVFYIHIVRVVENVIACQSFFFFNIISFMRCLILTQFTYEQNKLLLTVPAQLHVEDWICKIQII